MKDKKYFPTLAVIYVNYLVHGIALIILSQNITYLQEQMNTDYAGVMFVVSGLGIGKLITQYPAGILSDRFGRRPFMYLSILSYVVFFLGTLISPNIYVGFVFSFICGFGNTCLDSGGTPALMEILDKMMGTASILTKLFIAAGQFLLPIVIGFTVARQMYYGVPFILCAGILAVLGLCLIKVPFVPIARKKPGSGAKTGEAKAKDRAGKTAVSEKTAYPDGNAGSGSSRANMKIEGLALVILGYTTTATFHTIINWITIYAGDVAGMSETAAASVMSFYSTGAVIAVAVTAVLVQKAVKSVRLLILYPTLATIAITVLLMFPSDLTCRVCGFLIGCFAGGGVLQLAAAVIVEFFPDNKGTVTGMVFTASGVAMFAGPNITGWLSGMSVSYVLVYDIVVTLLGVCLAILVNIRYNQVVCPKRK